MAATKILTWDIVPPRRPTLADVGDAQLQDHATRPPKPPTQPCADQLNEYGRQIPRLGGIVPAATISIRFSGGTPSIDSFAAMPTAVVTNTFTVTDNGNGDTTITWPANTFPPPAYKPKASLNSDVAALAPVAFYVSNGVHVKTRNSAGTLTDMDFTVDIG